jgi:hyperosmotically inducible periplasmic protein
MKKTAILAGTVITALALVGCGKAEEEQTIGQQADSAVAQAEQSAREMGQDARQGMERAGEAIGEQVERAGDAIGDAAISAQVNAELAKDPQLSALDIDVDTTAGRVKLSGTAPSTEARDRATVLAANVQGVQSVDNLLQVETRQQ